MEKTKTKIIAKVRENKGRQSQKLVTIPKKCGINVGDYVRVEKIEMGGTDEGLDSN